MKKSKSRKTLPFEQDAKMDDGIDITGMVICRVCNDRVFHQEAVAATEKVDVGGALTQVWTCGACVERASAEARALGEPPAAVGTIDPARLPAIGTRFHFPAEDDVIEFDFVVTGYAENNQVIEYNHVDRDHPEPGVPCSSPIAMWNKLTAPRVEYVQPPLIAGAGAGQADMAPPPTPIVGTDTREIPVAAVREVRNIRERMDQAELAELAANMHRLGLLEPIVVRPVYVEGSNPAEAPVGCVPSTDHYELIAGHRRLLAARDILHWEKIPAVIRHGVDDKRFAEEQLAENLQRSDLTHMEIARAIAAAESAGLTSRQIADTIGKSMDFVQKHRLLGRLAEPVAILVDEGTLPVKLAEKIAAVGSHKKQVQLAGLAVHRDWDEKAGSWTVSDLGHNADPIVWAKYIMPMSDLMDAIAWSMRGIAGGGWPVDVEYAGKPPCQGCTAWSETYTPEDPEFWAGCKPQCSGAKGFCTDEACYNVKLKLAEKEKAKRKEEKEKKLAQSIAQAKGMGFAVCDQCGKQVADEKELKAVGKQKLCEKCAQKAERARSYGGGGDYEAHRKEVDRLKKQFPWTAAQKYAKALFDYGVSLSKLVIAAAGGEGKKAPANVERIILQMTCLAQQNEWISDAVVKLAQVEVGQPLPGALLADRMKSAVWALGYNEPGLDWKGQEVNVPLQDKTIRLINNLEAIAKYWKLDLGKLKRPVEGSFTDSQKAAAAEEKKKGEGRGAKGETAKKAKATAKRGGK